MPLEGFDLQETTGCPSGQLCGSREANVTHRCSYAKAQSHMPCIQDSPTSFAEGPCLRCARMRRTHTHSSSSSAACAGAKRCLCYRTASNTSVHEGCAVRGGLEGLAWATNAPRTNSPLGLPWPHLSPIKSKQVSLGPFAALNMALPSSCSAPLMTWAGCPGRCLRSF